MSRLPPREPNVDYKADTPEQLFPAQDEQYQKLGLIGVPILPGQKKPAVKSWQKLADLSPAERLRLRDQNRDRHIGLLAGTALPNDRRFGFIDVDHPGFVLFVKEVFGSYLSGKIGGKGLTIFCQVDSDLKSAKLKRKGASAPAVEVFVDSGQTIIPPSLHPSGVRYRWEGQPLLEIELAELPILDRLKLDLLSIVVRNEHAWAIVDGGAEVKAHDLMLSLTSCGIADLTDDLEWLAGCLNALLHPDYAGNTQAETLGMLQSAKKKGLGRRVQSDRHYDPGEDGPVPLGFTRDGLYAFRDQHRKIIIRASANQLLSLQYLLGLAPSEFWASRFPSEKGMFNGFAAGEALIAACKAVGPFDPLTVRGRGIWRDGDRVVINLGKPVPEDLRHVYLCFERIALEEVQAFETQRLLDHLRCFRWRNPQDAMLLLGWLAMGPICGVLNWRPHCFLYGPPRCGKTTIHTLAARLLHPLVISTDGQSSEAGIRQTLGPDSLAIIIDEFESDQQGAGLRGVLRLARSASSADSPVLRGTPEGKAMQFSLRTTFFFCAVNPGRMSPADQTRILLLELLGHDSDPAMARRITTEEAHFRDLGPSWCGYMVSRAGLLGPAVDTFEPVMPSADRRHRQNVATLLAAAFIALHGRVPSADEAQQWASEYAPAIEHHAQDIERDNSMECLQHLLSHVVERFPLSHWIALAIADLSEDDHRRFDAERIMRIYDVVVRTQGDVRGVLIRNGSPNVEDVFRNTVWEGRGWERALRALEGAFSVQDPVYFGGSRTKSRCIGIPLELIPEPIETPADEKGW